MKVSFVMQEQLFQRWITSKQENQAKDFKEYVYN